MTVTANLMLTVIMLWIGSLTWALRDLELNHIELAPDFGYPQQAVLENDLFYQYYGGSTVCYRCKGGYERISDESEISCLVSGLWDNDVLVCKPKDCGVVPPGTFSTGTATSGTTYPNVANYTCDEGYEIVSGNEQISCLATGQWDVLNVLVCGAKDCGVIPQGTFSTGTATSGTTYPNEADYTCDNGTKVESGNSTIACLATGQWDVDNVLVCGAKHCGVVPSSTFSTGTAESCTTYPNVANYTCDEGYEIVSGNEQISCLASGQWDVDNALVCGAKDCGVIPQGTFSTGTATSGTTYPNEADYTCDNGTKVESGNSTIACLATGQWDVDNVLVCGAKHCGVVPRGTFSTGTAESCTTYPNVANYTCDEGYEIVSGNEQISCLASGQWDVDNALVCGEPCRYESETLPGMSIDTRIVEDVLNGVDCGLQCNQNEGCTAFLDFFGCRLYGSPVLNVIVSESMTREMCKSLCTQNTQCVYINPITNWCTLFDSRPTKFFADEEENTLLINKVNINCV